MNIKLKNYKEYFENYSIINFTIKTHPDYYDEYIKKYTTSEIKKIDLYNISIKYRDTSEKFINLFNNDLDIKEITFTKFPK